MNPFWVDRLPQGALVLAIVGLACLSVSRTSARAGEADIQFLLSETLESNAFQELPPQSASEKDGPERITDAALTLAAFSQQQLHGARQMGAGHAGYDDGFVIISPRQSNLCASDASFLLKMNGWGHLRQAIFESQGANPDVNQFQLKRARLIFSGHTFTSDFSYFVQLDGRSSSGDSLRLLDYFLTYDVGHHVGDWGNGTLVFKTGKYKMPFTMARYLSGREFEFADRSMASTFFDVDRSLGWGLAGALVDWNVPWNWEVAVFNGLVTGGAETGSSGQLDDNFAYSGRIFAYPTGVWGSGELADFQWHDTLAMRTGMAFANATIHASGMTEFDRLRVVDSGATLASLLPGSVDQYTVNLYSIDASLKWRGWSTTLEYYFRHINQFAAPAVGTLFDHGLWFQLGKFVVPNKLQLLARWSRVVGNSGTLGGNDQSAEEIAWGAAWYFRDQSAKVTLDATYLDGAPVSSASLDINSGDTGWLIRSQFQFAF